MSLEQRVDRLPERRRVALAIRLLRMALPIWEIHVQGRPVEYRDTVVGMPHAIAPDLLRRCLDAVERFQRTSWLVKVFSARREITRLAQEFDDPIVALQDLDLELPDPVKLVFYAGHNLLEHLVTGGLTTFGHRQIYVAINQAVDALQKSGVATAAELDRAVREA